MEGARSGYKRGYSDSVDGERNGRYNNKRRNQSSGDPYGDSGKIQADDVLYRIICPGSKVGSVIGKGGSIIKALRQETGAKIKIEDAAPGADERVIIIAASSRLRDRRDRDGSDEKHVPSVQEALFKVHARIVEGESNGTDDEDDEDETNNVTTKLLVPSNQIGCLLGRGGKIIEQMRNDTGAQIRIVSKEQLPRCALSTDELVQISGGLPVVRKALHAIASRLYENPPKSRTQGISPVAGGNAVLPPGSFLPHGSSYFAPSGVGGPMIGLLPQMGGLGGGAAGDAWPFGSGLSVLPMDGRGQKNAPEEEFVVRMLCPNEIIGNIIGKKGNIIRQLRDETRAQIKISDPVPGADERIIIISSREVLGYTTSPTFDAALKLQEKISELSPEKDGGVSTRLLVPSANIGCLLGRGGSIITEMRKVTRANIRILPKDALPSCALESDELVQIGGDLMVSREAILQVLARLRANLFKEHLENGGKNSNSVPLSGFSQGTTAPASEYDDRYESTPPGALYGAAPSLGLQGSFRSSYGSSPGAWALQGDGLGGLSTYGGVGSQASNALGRGRSSAGLLANVAATTLEITIPNTVVSSVIGKGGSNVAQIRQISGAKVKVHDTKPGAEQCIIEISGTPEQTQAAQSLLEAFLITAQSQGSHARGSMY